MLVKYVCEKKKLGHQNLLKNVLNDGEAVCNIQYVDGDKNLNVFLKYAGEKPDILVHKYSPTSKRSRSCKLLKVFRLHTFFTTIIHQQKIVLFQNAKDSNQ